MGTHLSYSNMAKNKKKDRNMLLHFASQQLNNFGRHRAVMGFVDVERSKYVTSVVALPSRQSK